MFSVGVPQYIYKVLLDRWDLGLEAHRLACVLILSCTWMSHPDDEGFFTLARKVREMKWSVFALLRCLRWLFVIRLLQLFQLSASTSIYLPAYCQARVLQCLGLGVGRYCFCRYCRAFLRPGRQNTDWSHSVEGGGFCHPLASHRREREALVALGGLVAALAALQRRLQLLLEVAVEEAVHHGVDTRGGHRCQVAGGEDSVVLAVGQGLVVPVKQRVEDIQWQPAQGERYDNG